MNRFVHGDGSVVVVPARVCAWLSQHADLQALRRQHRGRDQLVDDVLVALSVGSAWWRANHIEDASLQRSPLAAVDEAPAELPLMLTTSEAADRLEVTPRAVQLAISEERLPAHRAGRTWLIAADDLAHYQEARTAC